MVILFQGVSKFLHNENLPEHVCSCVLGTFFLLSGFGKILNVNALIIGVQMYGFPNLLSPLMVFLPTSEIIIGSLLFIPVARKETSMLVLFLLMIFTGAYLYGYYFRGIEKCGCMGELPFLDSSLWYVVLRNLILFGLALYVWRKSRIIHGGLLSWQRTLIFILSLIVATTSGASSIEPIYQKPDSFVGKNIHETPLADIISTSPQATYLLFFYSINCPKCWNEIENIKALWREGIVDSVIGFTLGKNSSLAKFERATSVTFRTHLLSIDQIKVVTLTFPTAIYVKHDTIFYIGKDRFMAPLSFKESVLRQGPIWF